MVHLGSRTKEPGGKLPRRFFMAFPWVHHWNHHWNHKKNRSIWYLFGPDGILCPSPKPLSQLRSTWGVIPSWIFQLILWQCSKLSVWVSSMCLASLKSIWECNPMISQVQTSSNIQSSVDVDVVIELSLPKQIASQHHHRCSPRRCQEERISSISVWWWAMDAQESHEDAMIIVPVAIEDYPDFQQNEYVYCMFPSTFLRAPSWNSRLRMETPQSPALATSHHPHHEICLRSAITTKLHDEVARVFVSQHGHLDPHLLPFAPRQGCTVVLPGCL